MKLMPQSWYGSVEAIRTHTAGRWEGLLARLAPVLRPALERPGHHTYCPVHGGKHGDAFRVFRDVAQTGGGICNTCGDFPDGLALLQWVNGWDFRTTLREVALELGMPGGTDARALVRPALRPISTPAPDPVENERRRQRLQQTWDRALPLTERDAALARQYLANRGLKLPVYPTVLRFHPSLPYYTAERQRLGEFPALLALMVAADGQAVTLHRTYLTPAGGKLELPAPHKAKKMMAYPADRTLSGGAIRLFPAQGPLLSVAEGIETALAVQQSVPWIPVWAAGSATLLRHLQPSVGVQGVLIWADRDPLAANGKQAGQEAADELRRRLLPKGFRVFILTPPARRVTRSGKVDWLDVLNHAGAVALRSAVQASGLAVP